jgi:hypothetical protein
MNEVLYMFICKSNIEVTTHPMLSLRTHRKHFRSRRFDKSSHQNLGCLHDSIVKVKMLKYNITNKSPIRPKKLRFGVLSAQEIERMSVCQVTETTLYYRGLPASGGLLDPLMGSVDRRHLCATCMCDAKFCQGHPGHIQ